MKRGKRKCCEDEGFECAFYSVRHVRSKQEHWFEWWIWNGSKFDGGSCVHCSMAPLPNQSVLYTACFTPKCTCESESIRSSKRAKMSVHFIIFCLLSCHFCCRWYNNNTHCNGAKSRPWVTSAAQTEHRTATIAEHQWNMTEKPKGIPRIKGNISNTLALTLIHPDGMCVFYLGAWCFCMYINFTSCLEHTIHTLIAFKFRFVHIPCSVMANFFPVFVPLYFYEVFSCYGTMPCSCYCSSSNIFMLHNAQAHTWNAIIETESTAKFEITHAVVMHKRSCHSHNNYCYGVERVEGEGRGSVWCVDLALGMFLCSIAWNMYELLFMCHENLMKFK